MIVDFRKSTVPPPPPSVMDSPITSVESFRFLGTTITQDLKWEPTIISLIKKAQQRMYFLRQLRKAKLPAQMLVQFYTAIIESILTSSITVWFAGATVRDKQRLQRIVRSAEEVIGRSLPSLQDLSISSQSDSSEEARAHYLYRHWVGLGLTDVHLSNHTVLLSLPGPAPNTITDRSSLQCFLPTGESCDQGGANRPTNQQFSYAAYSAVGTLQVQSST
uniref:Alkylated DNA repair protein AlkB homologue 8 N-terminal domain-containing protein n=1 Tax=Knipowitschia caucasica TaxID=637954 RepID=A0AAV2KWQ0_KNICA